MRLWRALYASADVEEAVDSARRCWRGAVKAGVRARIARAGRARRAFREAMMAGKKSTKTPCEWIRACLTPPAAIEVVSHGQKEADVAKQRLLEISRLFKIWGQLGTDQPYAEGNLSASTAGTRVNHITSYHQYLWHHAYAPTLFRNLILIF